MPPFPSPGGTSSRPPRGSPRTAVQVPVLEASRSTGTLVDRKLAEETARGEGVELGMSVGGGGGAVVVLRKMN